MAKSTGKPHPAEEALRTIALSYPHTREDFPWGHSAIKVKEKAFLFMGSQEGTFSLSVKLVHSHQAALTLPFALPTGYGLGKSGWVSAEFAKGKKAPLDLLRQWLDESYRAVAPKTVLKALDAASAPATPQGKRAAAPRRTGKGPSRRKPNAR